MQCVSFLFFSSYAVRVLSLILLSYAVRVLSLLVSLFMQCVSFLFMQCVSFLFLRKVGDHIRLFEACSTFTGYYGLSARRVAL